MRFCELIVFVLAAESEGAEGTAGGRDRERSRQPVSLSACQQQQQIVLEC